ncbi:D-sedoheptulose-7-phosphate isomerase [Thiorhodovibrio frisius]|uniref:Phosphoheptose isomerase n=1 Tax=Thiorhodovibrio frisius TaxID=631362 RepID=H8Z176_9GAMM|nr:D-sedoheptulose 7-phosphate isomerase [Thiorhodovibrio frisius]EIC21391.1 phosphoheptose isomerase [Thiorhodovibrio frisius]WPL23977.1 Phosphoheptose isomerase 1 [Thiorhodovibrio frisius]
MHQRIRATLAEHIDTINALVDLTGEIAALAERGVATLKAGGRILWMGNGGSAADAQHLAAELVGRFERERPGLASIALTTDTSILTSVANDYGFEHIFARQVEAIGRPGDLLIGLSTSGNSPNVLRAMEVGARLGLTCAGLTGADGGALREQCELCLCVPSRRTARIQEAHQLIGHLLCDAIEAQAQAEAQANTQAGVQQDRGTGS